MKKLLVILLLWPTLAGAEATLTWQDNSDNEEGFIVQRRVPPAPFTELLRVPTNVSTARDVTAIDGGQVCYQVLAYISDRNSAPSNEVCIHVPLPIPNAPTNLQVEINFRFTTPEKKP